MPLISPPSAYIAQKRGVVLTSRSRPLRPVDLSRFDYIIGMDPKNIRAINEAGVHWESHARDRVSSEPLGEDFR